MDTYVVKRLEQAKLLTDPFKLRLLEQFAGTPVTTKQVADRMGEKAPKLYRHVDALAEEGLLELVEERPKRGTVERYYRTVADRFEVDPGLFSTTSDNDDDPLERVRSILRDTESDVLRVAADLSDDIDSAESLVLMRLAVRGTSQEIALLREKLESWLAECGALDAEDQSREDLVSYAGMIAFYPRPSDV